MENPFKELAGGSLEDFTPKAKTQTHSPAALPPSPVQLERLAGSQGFTIDNHPLERRALKAGRVASKDRPQPMSLRIRVPDWNKFSAFCERNEFSVAEGFAKLAALAEKL